MKKSILIVVLLAIGVGVAFAQRPVDISRSSARSLASVIAAPYQAIVRSFPMLGSDHTKEDLTVLILGKAGAGWTAGELTDTILLASFDRQTGRTTMLSLPRDLLVTIDGYQGKINSLWLLGKQHAQRNGVQDIAQWSDHIRRSVETITGMQIDEIVVVNVTAAETVIDELGGIAIDVTEHIIDPRYPTPGGGTERFEIEPGFHVLDGSTAVKYARTRSTREGDFGRIRRQHHVVEATVSKARGLSLFSDFATITRLFESVSENTETTVSLSELPTYASLVQHVSFAHLETFALETLQARGSDQPLLTSAGFAAGLVPRAGFYDYREIHEAVAELTN